MATKQRRQLRRDSWDASQYITFHWEVSQYLIFVLFCMVKKHRTGSFMLRPMDHLQELRGNVPSMLLMRWRPCYQAPVYTDVFRGQAGMARPLKINKCIFIVTFIWILEERGWSPSWNSNYAGICCNDWKVGNHAALMLIDKLRNGRVSHRPEPPRSNLYAIVPVGILPNAVPNRCSHRIKS